MTTTMSVPVRRMGCLGWGLGSLVGGVIALLVALAAGYVYQTQSTASDFEQFPAPGRRVDVGGYSLHVLCQGKGSPTVVVDAGNSDFSLGWSLVQPQVAQVTRICTYDHAGYGWSDPGPGPRTARHMAGELHTLLINAEIGGPYVLVGHSLGGYTVRMFADLYPDQVVGMVLVDAGHKEQLSRLPTEHNQIIQQQERYFGLMGTLAQFGVLRLLGKSAGEKALPSYVAQLPEDVRDVYVTMTSHPSYFDATLDELASLGETCTQVGKIGTLGDVPLVVLTAEHSIDTELLQSIGLPADLPIERFQPLWLSLQTELATLSTNGSHLVAEDSGHAVHLDRPDLVLAAIEQVLAQNDPAAKGQTDPVPTPSPGIAHLGMPWANFALRFDPTQWEVSAFEKQPALEALAHRTLPECRITPNVPVGLGEGWTVQREQRTFGDLTLGIDRFWQQSQLRFVVYTGFRGNLHDGSVEVHFERDTEACLEAAEALFSMDEAIYLSPQS